MDVALKKVLVVTRIIMAILFLNGLSYCFTTYVVAPEKYENKNDGYSSIRPYSSSKGQKQVD